MPYRTCQLIRLYCSYTHKSIHASVHTYIPTYIHLGKDDWVELLSMDDALSSQPGILRIEVLETYGGRTARICALRIKGFTADSPSKRVGGLGDGHPGAWMCVVCHTVNQEDRKRCMVSEGTCWRVLTAQSIWLCTPGAYGMYMCLLVHMHILLIFYFYI